MKLRFNIYVTVEINSEASWLEVCGSPANDLKHELEQYLYDIEGLVVEQVEVEEA